MGVLGSLEHRKLHLAQRGRLEIRFNIATDWAEQHYYGGRYQNTGLRYNEGVFR
jgi:hypothetical protein